MPKIKDNGQRTTFETGAMREIDETKGRCDLVYNAAWGRLVDDTIYMWLENFIRTGCKDFIFYALHRIVIKYYDDDYDTAYLDLSKHYAEGAKKYADRNMEKGLPWHSCVDSALRHYTKLRRGDADEPHLPAVLWNLLTLLYMVDHHPEMNDLPIEMEEKEI